MMLIVKQLSNLPNFVAIQPRQEYKYELFPWNFSVKIFFKSSMQIVLALACMHTVFKSGLSNLTLQTYVCVSSKGVFYWFEELQKSTKRPTRVVLPSSILMRHLISCS